VDCKNLNDILLDERVRGRVCFRGPLSTNKTQLFSTKIAITLKIAFFFVISWIFGPSSSSFNTLPLFWNFFYYSIIWENPFEKFVCCNKQRWGCSFKNDHFYRKFVSPWNKNLFLNAYYSLSSLSLNTHIHTQKNYRAFHGFGQSKFPYDGLIWGSSQFSLLPQLPKKNNTLFKSGQIWVKINHFALLI